MVGDPCPMHKRFHTILGSPRTLFCPAYTMAGTSHHGCSMSLLIIINYVDTLSYYLSPSGMGSPPGSAAEASGHKEESLCREQAAGHAKTRD